MKYTVPYLILITLFLVRTCITLARRKGGRGTADVGVLLTLLLVLGGPTQEAGGDEAGGGGGERSPQVGHQFHEGGALGVEDTVGREAPL